MEDSAVREDQTRYELMIIVRPDIGEDAIKKRLDQVRKKLTEDQGKVFFEDMWGSRDLTYTIKKHGNGYYAVFDFYYDPGKLKELDAMLRLEPEILRHLIMKLPAVYEPHTLTEMVETASKAAEEEKLKKAEAKKPKKFAKVEEKAAAVQATKVPSEAGEKTEAKPAPKKPKKKEETKQTLEDVDAKLKSIIENPDINF